MKLAQKIVLFCSICGLLHLFLYHIFTQKFGKGDLWKAEQQILYPPQGYQYLFMGDSRANKALVLEQIPNAQKWAAGGESVAMRYYKLKKLIENSPNSLPQLVILSNDFSIYSKNNINYIRNLYYYNTIIDYQDWGELHHTPYQSHLNYYIYRSFPYIESRDIFLRGMENVFLFGMDNVANLGENSAASNYATAHNFVWNELLSKHSDDLYSDLGLIFLQRTLDLCQQHHIALALLSYPMPDCTRQIADTVIASQTSNPIDSLLQHYPTVSIWDYRKLFSEQDSFFTDIMHLNKSGAKLFSQQIAAELSCWEAENNHSFLRTR